MACTWVFWCKDCHVYMYVKRNISMCVINSWIMVNTNSLLRNNTICGYFFYLPVVWVSRLKTKWQSCQYIYYRVRARNTFARPRGSFRDLGFLKVQCLASVLVDWLQLTSWSCVCYLAVKYVTLNIKMFFKNL